MVCLLPPVVVFLAIVVSNHRSALGGQGSKRYGDLLGSYRFYKDLIIGSFECISAKQQVVKPNQDQNS